MASDGLPDHGTRKRYQRGCKCRDCTTSNRIYQREYRASWRVSHRPDGAPVRYREPPLPGLTTPRGALR